MGIISATLFLRTQLHPYTVQDGTKYAAFTFFSLLIMLCASPKSLAKLEWL